MRLLFIVLILTSLLAGCHSLQSSNKAGHHIICETVVPVIASTAAGTRLQCKGQVAFEAECDFTQDPLEFKKSHNQPKDLIWKVHGLNEGVEFNSDGGSGFMTCKRL